MQFENKSIHIVWAEQNEAHTIKPWACDPFWPLVTQLSQSAACKSVSRVDLCIINEHDLGILGETFALWSNCHLL